MLELGWAVNIMVLMLSSGWWFHKGMCVSLGQCVFVCGGSAEGFQVTFLAGERGSGL